MACCQSASSGQGQGSVTFKNCCVAANGPLDVIRTRLALEEFGRPNHVQSTLSLEYQKIVREEGFRALYSGWQVVFLQFILDYWIRIWDTKVQRQKGSIFALFPMLIKFITDYAFTVIKIRANMKNPAGILTIIKNVFSENGLRGFMAGWKIHLLLFPLVMVNMILANIVFLQLKKFLFPHNARHHKRSGSGGILPHPPPPEIIGDGGLRRSGGGDKSGTQVGGSNVEGGIRRSGEENTRRAIGSVPASGSSLSSSGPASSTSGTTPGDAKVEAGATTVKESIAGESTNATGSEQSTAVESSSSGQV